MKFKCKTPGLTVQRRIKKHGGGFRIKPWFRFDENGYAEIDETKVTATDLIKLKKKFEVVEDTKEIKDMSYQELQVAYAEKTGNSAVGKRKKDILKELEG